MQEWLRQAGLELPELVLENGSGLSRSERISARNLARLLQRGWNSPLMPEYLASLPIPGVDGTLRRRLAGSPASGQAHLKSGYLEGVRAIAGYVRDHRGRWLHRWCASSTIPMRSLPSRSWMRWSDWASRYASRAARR